MQLRATSSVIDPSPAIEISGGQSAPLGATPVGNGVNFSVYSRDASGIELLLFDREDDAQPARVISSRSVSSTAPITTGTFLFPVCRRGRSTDIEFTDHSIQRGNAF